MCFHRPGQSWVSAKASWGVWPLWGCLCIETFDHREALGNKRSGKYHRKETVSPRKEAEWKSNFYTSKLSCGQEVELVSDKAASPVLPGLDVVVTALLPCEEQSETVGSPEQMLSACLRVPSSTVSSSVPQEVPQGQVWDKLPRTPHPGRQLA